jgi:plasmid stability protein
MHNGSMEVDVATVTLKNVPDELLRLLKTQARQNRRSLNQEALARLEASVLAPGRGGRDTVTALRRLHRRLRGQPPLTAAFLTRAKNDGRS